MFFAVRLPLSIVFSSTILVVIATWWIGVRKYDFLTPPSEQRIAEIRAKTQESLKKIESIAPEQPVAAILVKADRLVLPDAEKEKAIILAKPEDEFNMGDITVAPGLDCFSDLASKGAGYLMDVASHLESNGDYVRALLAWERVMDSTASTPEQFDEAVKSTQRLSSSVPSWNVDEEGTLHIRIHAGADRETAKMITPVLQEAATIITSASSGIVDVKSIVASGAPAKGGPKMPIAIWFSGENDKTISSKTIALPSETSDPAALRKSILACGYKLVRDSLTENKKRTPLPELQSADDPAAKYATVITRLAWQDFANYLNQPNSTPTH